MTCICETEETGFLTQENQYGDIRCSKCHRLLDITIIKTINTTEINIK